MDTSKLPGGNLLFPSTGDPDLDAGIAASIRRCVANEAEGLCPNGCAPLEFPEPGVRTCPVCGFLGQTFRLGG